MDTFAIMPTYFTLGKRSPPLTAGHDRPVGGILGAGAALRLRQIPPSAPAQDGAGPPMPHGWGKIPLRAPLDELTSGRQAARIGSYSSLPGEPTRHR